MTTILMLYGIHRVSRFKLQKLQFFLLFLLSNVYSNRIGPHGLPSIVVNIVELIVGILYATLIIPICTLVFWDETKDYFIRFQSFWTELTTTDTKTMMSVLWVEVVFWTGVFVIFFPIKLTDFNKKNPSMFFTAIQWYLTAVITSLYEFMKNPNEEDSNNRQDATELV